MKKIIITLAVAAMCICAVSCGNNTNKKTAEGECTECTDTTVCADTTKKCCECCKEEGKCCKEEGKCCEEQK